MRSVRVPIPTTLLLAPFLLASLHNANAIDERVPDPNTLTALVTKAQNAAARDQCFLYAELVHQMTELAGRQMSTGSDAHKTLTDVHDYAQKIHIGVANDTRKLKNAQILMEHTAFRLNEILHSSALEDRPVLESTLKQLDQVQSELMMQVFKH